MAVNRRSLAQKGKPKSAAHRKRMSEVRIGKSLGSENPNWRGGDWCDHMREKGQVVNADRLAKRNHKVPSTLTLGEWLEVLDEHNRNCAYCLKPTTTERHKPNTLQLDHVTPMSRGGANSRDNVVPACRDCNTRRNGKASSWVPHIASRFWPKLAEELYA